MEYDIYDLYDIYNPSCAVEIVEFDVQIKSLSYDIDTIDNMDIDKKKAKLDELKELIEQAKLNENQESSKPYYKELQQMITFKKFDFRYIKDVEDILNFIEVENGIKTIDIKKLSFKK